MWNVLYVPAGIKGFLVTATGLPGRMHFARNVFLLNDTDWYGFTLKDKQVSLRIV
jgi:hypothetical protein